MKKITISLLCAGVLTTVVIAEDICDGAFQAQNYDRAAKCYVQQLKKQKSFDNFRRAGSSYCKQGRYKEALPYLKEAEKKAKSLEDYKILYSWIDSVYANLGDTTQELVYSMKFLDLSLKSGDNNNIGKAYNNLGAYYKNQNQPQKALEFYQKALEYNEESKSSTIYGNMAIIYNSLNDFSKAQEMYQKSIMIDQNIGDYNSLGTHKTELGIFYFNQERYSEARATLEDAIIMTHKSGNIRSEAHALSILSMFDYREGSVSKAKERAAEGLRLAKQSGDPVALDGANIAWEAVNRN